MITLKTYPLILSFLLVMSEASAQENEILYFKLNKDQYTKLFQVIPATVPVKRKLDVYNFTLPCPCKGNGSIGFYSTTDSALFNPISTITDRQAKKLKYISITDLVVLLKKYDLEFNRMFTIYLVEFGKKNLVYHVQKQPLFSDEVCCIGSYDN